MLSLDAKQQAFFVGVRSTFYRLAMIFGSGVLVVLAGNLEKSTGSITISWTAVLAIASGVFLLAFVFHRYYLPYPHADRSGAKEGEKAPFVEVFRT